MGPEVLPRLSQQSASLRVLGDLASRVSLLSEVHDLIVARKRCVVERQPSPPFDLVSRHRHIHLPSYMVALRTLIFPDASQTRVAPARRDGAPHQSPTYPRLLLVSCSLLRSAKAPSATRED